MCIRDSHTLLKGEVGSLKKRLDKVGAFVQQSLDDVDVHLVAVSANCTVAVDIPVSYTHLLIYFINKQFLCFHLDIVFSYLVLS